MKVDLTDEMIEMEPGPSLYFMGSVKDFEHISKVFYELASKSNIEISLDDVCKGLIVIPSGLKIIFRSQENGKILSKIEGSKVVIELPPILWFQISNSASVLGQKPSHIYIEFDDLALREDCNIIMSSEW